MRSVTTERLVETLASPHPPLLVNVLRPKQFEAGHIRGSVNVPADDPRFVELVGRAAGDDRQRPIVIYDSGCDSRAAPDEAAAKLEAAGFSEVAIYRGGLKAWIDDGQNVAPFGTANVKSSLLE